MSAEINRNGLKIEGPVNEFTVRVRAVTPDGLPERIDRAIVASNSHHTRSAAELLPQPVDGGRLVPTVRTVSRADVIDAVGRDRVLSFIISAPISSAQAASFRETLAHSGSGNSPAATSAHG